MRKVSLISFDRESFTDDRACTILGTQSTSIDVDMHFFISSCINYEVVIDFFITVKTIDSVNGYIFLFNLRIISFRHIKANLVTPERRLPMHCNNSPTIKVRTSSFNRSEWN